MGGHLKGLIQRLAHFLFPITCSGCGKALGHDDHYRVCTSCLKEVKFIEGLFCKKCGIPLQDGGAHCWYCRKNPKVHYELIRSVTEYTGVIKDLLIKLKFHNKDFLERFIGRLLITGIDKYPELSEQNVDYIVPVPLHWAKKIKRGYNQAELLARPVSEYLKKPLMLKWLKRGRFTKAQFHLKREDRIKNLENSFTAELPKTYKGARILLVDDICTTGTTIEQCALALKRAGSGKIYALTVARDI